MLTAKKQHPRANAGLRKTMRDAGVYQWQLADALGISEGEPCRLLRREVDPETRTELAMAIDSLATKKVASNPDAANGGKEAM